MKPYLLFRNRILTLCMTISCYAAVGQSGGIITGIEHFNTQRGLADNTVNALLVDTRGSLWIGTENGLNRYLNTDFERFNEESPAAGLAGHSVSTLFMDSRGWIWAGDRFLGLSCYDPVKNEWKRFHNQSGETPRFEGKEIIDMVEDEHGDIWFAAFPCNLFRYSLSNDSFYGYNLGVLTGFQGIQSLHLLNKNELMVHTATEGLLLFNLHSGRFRKYHEFYRFFGIEVLNTYDRICTDKAGSIVLMHGGNILLLGKGREKPLTIGTYPRQVRPVFHYTAKGELLVGAGPDILHFDAAYRLLSRNSILADKNGPVPVFKSICMDHQGVVWLGSQEGVIKIDPAKQVFRSFANMAMVPLKEGMEDIRSICSDRQGNTWLGPRMGSSILRVRKKEGSEDILAEEFRLVSPDHYKHTINYILELDDGRILAAGYSGMFIKNGKGDFHPVLKNYDHHKPLCNTWSLYQLDDDNLLVGTRDMGLYRYTLSSKKLTRISFFSKDEKPFPKDFATWNMYRDKTGRLWLATSRGLFQAHVLSPDSYKLIPYLPLRDCSVWAVCEARNGTVWFGTIEYGLFGIDANGKRVRSIGLNAGLPSLTIRGIVEDAEGQLWVSTASCISRIRFTADSLFIRNFDVPDGLPVEGFSSRAAVQGPGGNLFFASKRGILYFDPRLLNTPKKRAQLLLRNCFVSDKAQTPPGTGNVLLLPAGSSSFSIEPALTDYGNPEKNRFYYLLEGIDKTWRKASGKHPFIQYAGLLPGEYRLRIRAGNPDGVAALNEILIPVKVGALFWQQSWFKVSLFAISFALVVYMTYLALNRLRLRRKLVKSEIASLRLQMNPHFIFNSLNSIQDFIYHDEKELAGLYLTRVARLIRLIMENSGKTMVSLEEEIGFLKIYLELESLRLASRLSYSIDTDPSIDTGEYYIPPMILQPLIENALKHGMGGTRRSLELKILFEKKQQDIWCSIIDNGVGFHGAEGTAHSDHQSMGLHVVQERLKLLNRLEGRRYFLKINDTNRYYPGEGTEINIQL